MKPKRKDAHPVPLPPRYRSAPPQWPWRLVEAGVGGTGLSRSCPLPVREDGYRFVPFVDTRFGRERVSGYTSSAVVDASNALVAALRRADALDVAEIMSLLWVLRSANEACSGERLPRRLHLHVGPDVRESPDTGEEAGLLRDLCAAADTVQKVMDDGACVQMLGWITDAWRAWADALERRTRPAGPSDTFEHSVDPVAETADPSGAPRRVVWRDDGIPWRDEAQVAAEGRSRGESRAPLPGGGARFFAVLDDVTRGTGLGSISSVHTIAHRDRLVAALMTARAFDVDLIRSCLRVLWAENKAGCRSDDPEGLYLYMGPGRVRNRELGSAARFLWTLSGAARAIARDLEERELQQTLQWMAEAWRSHAQWLEGRASGESQKTVAPQSARAGHDESGAMGAAQVLQRAQLRDDLLTALGADDRRAIAAVLGSLPVEAVLLDHYFPHPSLDVPVDELLRAAVRYEAALGTQERLSQYLSHLMARRVGRALVEEAEDDTPDLLGGFDPRLLDLCATLGRLHEKDLQSQAGALLGQMAAVSGDTLAVALATQPLAGIRMLQQRCSVLEANAGQGALAAFRQALDEAQRMQQASRARLRDVLLQRRVGKLDILQLAKMEYAKAMTSSPADNRVASASSEEIHTLHRHLVKVIRHMSTPKDKATPYELHALRYVESQLQRTLEVLQRTFES